jgi:hypothetical protein
MNNNNDSRSQSGRKGGEALGKDRPSSPIPDTNLEDMKIVDPIHEPNEGNTGVNGGYDIDASMDQGLIHHKNNTSDGYYDV